MLGGRDHRKHRPLEGPKPDPPAPRGEDRLADARLGVVQQLSLLAHDADRHAEAVRLATQRGREERRGYSPTQTTEMVSSSVSDSPMQSVTSRSTVKVRVAVPPYAVSMASTWSVVVGSVSSVTLA